MNQLKIIKSMVAFLLTVKALLTAKVQSINVKFAEFIAFVFVSAGLPVPANAIDIMGTVEPLLGMLIGIVLLTVVLPISVAFILATNMTGWNSNLKTFWTTAIPAVIIIAGFALIMETIFSRGKSKSRGRRKR